ncbi:MAG: ABC transporter ATP-binding protein [Thermodesulfovibrionales bacterium]|nr:ABC transporter ATP-binding protein [Thermodesulfovibrionales bacterium]
MLIEIKNLTVSYGGITALRDINIAFEDKSIVSIIGANGAGKSTLLNSIMNLVPIASGEIYYQGKKISGLNSHELIKLGISLVPEGRMLFTHLTVRDNLHLGAYAFFRSIGRKEIRKRAESVYELFPILKERRQQIAGTLSGGQQQMLAIGRALMASPELLMLDEPSMGLAPILVRDIFNVIKHLNSQSISILLIEQNARAALKMSHYAFVLESGRLVGQGQGSKLLCDEKIKKAYLGG